MIIHVSLVLQGLSPGEEIVAKVNFTLEGLMDKYEHLQQKLDQLQGERVTQLAQLTRE